MCKKLSPLLLLLLCGSCNRLQVDPAVRSQPLASRPNMNAVMQAKTVEIYNDWNGYSDITPILRHYKLRIERQELVGNSHIAVGGYGAAGIHQQQTTRVKIPAAVASKFLATLAKTPLQTGTYQPPTARADDYPSIAIKLKIERQQVIFSSESQAKDYVPWKITVNGENTSKVYISNSAFPAQALQLLSPYLDRTGLDRIIQRRRQKQKS
jgi:hypothetical protein